jgi:3-hydroxyisobutyrate dehydrogenase
MPEPLEDATIGFVGLGNMGLPMSARLVAAGATVVGFDPNPDARARFADAGGTPADALADLAGLSTVVLMLPGSAVVESVLVDQGLAASLAPSALVIDMSSSEPMRTRALGDRLAGHGARLVDAPVSGGVKGAVNGTLTIMVGGSEADAAEIEPLLAVLGRPRRVGPVGAGHALKALNNLLSAAHLLVTSEAVLVGERFGLEPAAMLDAINASSGRSGSTENKWPNFILPGTYDSGFAFGLMVKDMRIATALAHDLGMPIALGDAAVELWERAAEDLPATADHTEVARWLRERSPDALPAG